MSTYTRAQFGATVRNGFDARRGRHELSEKSLLTSASPGLQHDAIGGLETYALGHPHYDNLPVGEKRTAPMVAVFLDLTDFTGRTFWDDQEMAALLADAVLSGFIEVVTKFGGYPLGLRGDGLFAGFSPGDPKFTAMMALSACAFALDGVENEVNPALEARGLARVQARAGLDYGQITFIRTGNRNSSEINPIGFAANFAAKCEKAAKSWEIVVGEGLTNLLPLYPYFDEHARSPKSYTRDYQVKKYKFFDYRWRRTLPHLPGVIETLGGTPTSEIHDHS